MTGPDGTESSPVGYYRRRYRSRIHTATSVIDARLLLSHARFPLVAGVCCTRVFGAPLCVSTHVTDCTPVRLEQNDNVHLCRIGGGTHTHTSSPRTPRCRGEWWRRINSFPPVPYGADADGPPEGVTRYNCIIRARRPAADVCVCVSLYARM